MKQKNDNFVKKTIRLSMEYVYAKILALHEQTLSQFLYKLKISIIP